MCAKLSPLSKKKKGTFDLIFIIYFMTPLYSLLSVTINLDYEDDEAKDDFM